MLDRYGEAELRRLLDRAEGAESVRQLMLAVAHKRGIDIDELAEWYGLTEERVEELLRQLETDPEQTVSGLERLSVSERAATPVGSGSRSVVEYLSYDAVAEHGWSLDDDDLFEKASEKLQGQVDVFGRMPVEPDESVAAAGDRAEVEWPSGCRGGACSNCAAYLAEGEIAMSGDHVLPDRVVREENVRLTCVGTPVTERVRLVYGVRHLDALEDLLLPAGDFEVERS